MAIIIGIAILSLTWYLTTTPIDFSSTNVQWNGTSQFFGKIDGTDVTDVSTLNSYSNATLLIIAPTRDYTGGEAEAIRTFLMRGNTLILADDFGTGNSLLQGMNSGITLLQDNLSSIDTGYTESTSVLAYPNQSHTLLRGVDTLCLDRPAAILGGNPLMATSRLSWIDTDGDHHPDNDENFRQYTIMANETFGDGELIVIADPSIFINGMVSSGDQWSNQRFIENIIGIQPPILVDTRHSATGKTTEILNWFYSSRSNYPVKFVLIGSLVLIIAWVFNKRSKREEGFEK
ncbi:conserved hypothetical protein [Methanosphaerula palustris E1-9c]|uniref:DUF4350 domain-containing protein n=1 Tax=Methanosphaerula palustris (strain ATCC BAA-1556 / DSM 19958 / E1-9c) TaxID=521011 RepID=B8GGA7_METPE|nr:conserved hypothetical protein [Methanosphaerula palustris E1-9c]